MKTFIPAFPRTTALLATFAFCMGSVFAEPTAPEKKHQVVVIKDGRDIDQQPAADGPGLRRKIIKIESIEPDREKTTAREVTWLGVATEETSDALASQLGLESGQGLLVNYVEPESPAAKAGLQKHDVLVELGDQMLVLPAQLRKLVQLKKEGDTVKLVLHRGGKKQTVSAKLAKRTENFGMLHGDLFLDGDRPELGLAFADGKIGDRVREEIKIRHGPFGGGSGSSSFGAGFDKKTVNIEVQRHMEEVSKAIQEAMRHSPHAKGLFGPDARNLEQLARGKMDVEKNASVTLKKGGGSVKTIVKSDDSGVYVIVANPKKYLTAHDKDGKLIFDGPIESEEQKEKVPADLWKKIKPSLEEIKPSENSEPKPQAQSEKKAKS